MAYLQIPRFEHGWLMKVTHRCLLPLLHKFVEERVGERRFPLSHPILHEPAVRFE
jgi:hypothetical protein